jgi:hypothetical protein
MTDLFTKPIDIDTVARNLFGITGPELRAIMQKAGMPCDGPTVNLLDAVKAGSICPPVRDERAEELRMTRMRRER